MTDFRLSGDFLASRSHCSAEIIRWAYLSRQYFLEYCCEAKYLLMPLRQTSLKIWVWSCRPSLSCLWLVFKFIRDIRGPRVKYERASDNCTALFGDSSRDAADIRGIRRAVFRAVGGY